MLKQILSDMYIDPELLAELSEEQKQILFFKMREEQIRRWKEREAALEKKEAELLGKSKPKKENRKAVSWKLGSDKEVWVWVMGEHQLDKPYDVICDEILAERTQQQQLQKEAEDLRKTQAKESSRPQSLHSDSKPLKNWEVPNDNEESGTESRKASTSEEEKIQLPSSSSRNIQQMLADSINRMKTYGFQQKKETMRKKQDEELKQVEEERTRQMYKSWKETQKFNKEEREWQESLRRSKAADEKRRSIAKQARDDYKRLSLAAQKGKGNDGTQNSQGVPQKPKRPPLPPKPQLLIPAGPPGRPHRNQGVKRSVSHSAQENIITWFKEEQIPLRAGFEKNSDTIAPWFHGEYQNLFNVVFTTSRRNMSPQRPRLQKVFSSTC